MWGGAEMVARAWERVESKKAGVRKETPNTGSTRGVEEMFVQNEAVSVCLLLNRRTKTMRVIDFRAGPSHAKRLFVLKLAQREGIEKVYTLVERDEVSTWMKLGFIREANIPAFYKRSDAFILGCSVAEAMAGNFRPLASVNMDDDGVDEPASSAAIEFAEKTIVAAKKQAKGLLDRQLPMVKLVSPSADLVKKASDKALRSGRALTAFEPFGRDGEQSLYQLTAKGGFELVARVESQGCFGNAFLELLTGPKTEADRLATVSALRTLCAEFIEQGIVSCFALAPSDDVALATAFVFNGFRRTGVLVDHVVVGRERKDAIVWSRKLANPTGE